MIIIKGFKTKGQAKRYNKMHGGDLCYLRDSAGKSKNKDFYDMAVLYGGLDPLRFPYCVIITD